MTRRALVIPFSLALILMTGCCGWRERPGLFSRLTGRDRCCSNTNNNQVNATPTSMSHSGVVGELCSDSYMSSGPIMLVNPGTTLGTVGPTNVLPNPNTMPSIPNPKINEDGNGIRGTYDPNNKMSLPRPKSLNELKTAKEGF